MRLYVADDVSNVPFVRASDTVLLNPSVATTFKEAVSAPDISATVAQPLNVKTLAAQNVSNTLFFIVLLQPS